MSKNLVNGLIAGVISAIIAFICWTQLADASSGTASGIAAAFFVGTTIIATLVSGAITKQVAQKQR
ncbi:MULTISPECIES: hypothetical protein [unclassified Luteococcus]|uniref:hypothetical protein n=1 Tax=unclassified Luteococcus TaxID=2639923 RepID=UPI00313BCC0F